MNKSSVKIFSDTATDKLEKEINNWLHANFATKTVKAIEYAATAGSFSAIIFYEN